MEVDGHVMLDPKKVKPSPFNNRVIKNKVADAELVKDIEINGQLQPGLVRKSKSKQYEYECIIGHRRLEACKSLGIEFRTEVKSMSDAETMAAIIAENIRRESIHPLDQANGIKSMLLVNAGDVRLVAEKLQLDEIVVRRRINLLQLSKEWQNELKQPDSMTTILKLSALEELARLPVHIQDEILEDLTPGKSGFAEADITEFMDGQAIREIASAIRKDLRGAIFDPADAELLPAAGPCTSCPKRASDRGLFADIKMGDDGMCQDKACYDEKAKAQIIWLQDQASEDESQAVGRIAGAGNKRDANVPMSIKPTVDIDQMTASKKTDKNAKPYISLRTLKTVWYKPKEKVTPKTTSKSGVVGKPEKGTQLTVAQKKKKLAARRTSHAVKAAQEWLRNLGGNKKLLDEVCNELDSERLLCYIAVFGTPWMANQGTDKGQAEWAAAEKLNVEKSIDKIVGGLAEIVAKRLDMVGLDDAGRAFGEVKCASKLFVGLDPQALMDDATIAIAEPASWNKESKGKAKKK